MMLANPINAIKGGIKTSNLAASQTKPLSVPHQNNALIFPLIDYSGNPVAPFVQEGESVAAGTVLAPGILASTSGVIQCIEQREFIHRSGQTALSAVLLPDDQQTQLSLPPIDINNFKSLKPYNIVGLGGAAFPLLRKLSVADDSGINSLVINAVECEPLVQCDNALMQWHADEVLQGIELLRQLCRLDNATIAIKSSMTQAINALHQAQTNVNACIEFKYVEDKYPAGAERTLIQTLNQVRTLGDHKPSELGILCINVATAHAIYKANQGQALLGRIITVANTTSVIENVWAGFGTPISDVLQAAGISNYQGTVIAGGPISGIEIDNLNMPIDASTNSLVVNYKISAVTQLPCIRCGDCAEVCPSNLLPQQLYWHAHSDNLADIKKYGLTECIECACCDLVCPSSIPLTQLFRHSKRKLADLVRENSRAEWAEQRFQLHEQRQLTRAEIRQQNKNSTSPLDRLKKKRREESAQPKPNTTENGSQSSSSDTQKSSLDRPPPNPTS